MSDSFALRQFGVSVAAVFALALSACGGGGGGGPAAELAVAPASAGGAAPVGGDSAAAGAPPGEGEAEPGVPVGEDPGEGGGVPGGESRSSSAAAWHAFGAAGTGPNGAALVTAGDLAGVSTAALDYASDTQPTHGRRSRFDRRSISQSDGLAARRAGNDMTVRVGHNGAGQVSYGLTYNESRGARDNPTYAWEWTFDSETAGTNVRRVSSDGGQGALFRRETDAGNLWAAVATDISGPGDTNWLATGVWAYAPAGGSEPWDWSGGYRFGVFAGGGEPYGGNLDDDARASLIPGLTGTATYEGDAAGVWSRLTGAAEATRRNDLFSADAALTIDFDDEPTYSEGVVIGRIHNMEIGGTPIAGSPEIALSGGRVFADGSISAYGSRATSMTFDGASWAGSWSWGAGLYGNPASGATGADRLPGSVAGTFGVGRDVLKTGRERRPDGDYVIGAFAARRTAWAPGGGAPAAPGGGSASPSGAAWHVFGEAGTGPTGDALVTAGDLSGVFVRSLDAAAPSNPTFGSGSPHLSQSDAGQARGARASMSVRVGHNDAGQVSYGLTYNERTTPRATLRQGETTLPTHSEQWELDSEAEGTNVRRWSSGGRKGALFRREDSAGNLWAAVSTDISGSGDTDWLAAGVWAYMPADGPSWPQLYPSGDHRQDSAGGARFGVFAGGGDPFRASSVAGLSGEATYEGDAAGVYSRRSEVTLSRRNGELEWTRLTDFFTADATLTIDFTSDSATGRIHDIAIDGTPIAGNPEIDLLGGRLRTSHGHPAFISGDPPDSHASMTFDGRNWSGDWGAALFGNPPSGATGADRMPGSVAGTFGVRWNPLPYELNTDYFIGVFGASRSAQTGTP